MLKKKIYKLNQCIKKQKFCRKRRIQRNYFENNRDNFVHADDIDHYQELSPIQTQHAYNRDRENGYLTANEFNAEIHNVMGLNTQHSAISKISETEHDKTHGYLEIIDMEPDETTINTSSV